MIVNKPTNAFHMTSLNMKKTTTYDAGDPSFYLAETLVVGTTPFTWVFMRKTKPVISNTSFVSIVRYLIHNLHFNYTNHTVQSVPITTHVVSSNLDQVEVHNIMWWFVSILRQVSGFLQVLRFPPPIQLTAMIYLKYCWKWR